MEGMTRPPTAPPRPDPGNLHSSHGAPNFGQQDPGMLGAGQDPGPPAPPQHHMPVRPVFYVHAPPPPPFLQYQWPMPFSYNPFAGFPGMGYGMVMPPFPPPPYMDAPAYIMPHPHLQPVDYRRLLQQQVHPPGAAYLNPNQPRRIRPSHTVPVRETVNSEVQTEPTRRSTGRYGDESPRACSDSGQGTASSSPSSSSSSSQKRGRTDVENETLPSKDANKDFEVIRRCSISSVKHGFNLPYSKGPQVMEPCIRTTQPAQNGPTDGVGQENVAPSKNSRCKIWSVSSSDSMIPVCSSSQREDEVVRERRISVPDILMSWAGSTPQGAILETNNKVPPPTRDQLPSYQIEVEHQKSVVLSPSEKQQQQQQHGPVEADGVDDTEDLRSKEVALHQRLSESRRENEEGLDGSFQTTTPQNELLTSLNKSHKFPETDQENDMTSTQEDATELVVSQLSLSSMKRKLNESVWSVESLAPFIPTKEWLIQNGLFEKIVEMTEAEKQELLTQNDNMMVQDARPGRRISSSDSVPLSDSWLVFSTPAKKLNMEVCSSAPSKRGQSAAPSGNYPSQFSALLQSEIVSTPPEEETGDVRSSEPVAIQSPNQEPSAVTKLQVECPRSPDQEETVSSTSAAVEKNSSPGQPTLHTTADVKTGGGVCDNQLCVPAPDQKMDEVSPSKRHLVDFGIQCSNLQEVKCQCGGVKGNVGPSGKPLKYQDVKKANNGKGEGFYKTGHRQGQWRNRRHEKYSGQQETYNGYVGKSKSKGGDEKKTQY